MSSNKILGKDVNVFVSDAGSDYPIICSTSCTLEKQFDVKETTHYTSTSKEFKTGMSEAAITLEGITTAAEINPGDKRVFDFFSGGVWPIKMTFTDQLGNTVTVTCNVIVPNISITAAVPDFSSYTLSMKVTGDLTIM